MKLFYLIAASLLSAGTIDAQTVDPKTDSILLSVIKDTVPKLPVQSIADAAKIPVERRNPFLSHTGKTIRSVRIKTLGFDEDINDTTLMKSGFGLAIANALHKNTRLNIIRNNLFFAKGQKVNPYLLSDNERFLREQAFLQDAVIIVNQTVDAPDAVDVLVMTKDVFSLGGGLGIGGTQKFRLEIKDENIGGSGSKVAVSTLIDNKRDPKSAYGAELLQRNIRGSFINMAVGFKQYNNAFNSNRNEENTYYVRFEKPLVSQYIGWMGNLDLSFNNTSNAYIGDSLYKSDYQYSYYNIDGWIAHNFGARKIRYKQLKSTARKFIALRAFHQDFNKQPQKTSLNYDGTYSNVTGMLASFSIFKQNFYRATYIYGFGRNEDVPVGFSASLIGGYTIRKDSLYDRSRTRPYYGVEGLLSNYNSKGFYSAYTFRLGGYHYRGKWEDVDVLMNVEHFTRLKKINTKWYKRYFFNGGIAKQFSPVLEQPLMLRSNFGLPYFEYGYVAADFRATVKSEIVFYKAKKLSGFGFAPFGFADFSLLKPTNLGLSKSDLFSAIGGGFRLRNENLIFGTVELRASYLPRIVPGMSHFKIKINTNLRYRYNSSFIRRPDFVLPN